MVVLGGWLFLIREVPPLTVQERDGAGRRSEAGDQGAQQEHGLHLAHIRQACVPTPQTLNLLPQTISLEVLNKTPLNPYLKNTRLGQDLWLAAPCTFLGCPLSCCPRVLRRSWRWVV